MSAENLSPDVVVVGMPSCGKTVFFTVLGKKFTNLVDGRRAAALGFRMGTCDRETAKVVDFAYDRLRRGRWPEATKEGQVMPLRWEVFTGKRRIFELFSMDIAGETFKKAFAIKDDAGGYDDGGMPPAVAAKSPVVGDSGDELYRGESMSDGVATAETRETDEDKAVATLRKAIETAKVVCFMVNIALPDRLSRSDGDDADEKKLLRFRSTVMNMYLSLKERPELCAKSLIVLTQTHRHRGAIERAGGPVMYLADVGGGAASELSNLVKEKDVPVIAVSAIDETEHGDNELPEIESPGSIPSSGLFGFLLTVSGMVAKDDGIARVKDAYLAYQREREEYLKCPSQTIRNRLVQARRCHDTAADFLKACDRYLDDAGNLDAKGTGISLSSSAVENYRRFTRNDADVRPALDKEYLVRDELWDRALRRAVVSGEQTTADAVYEEVRAGLTEKFPEKKRGNVANEEFVCGFGEDDFFPEDEASTFEGWIELNLSEYEKLLDEDVAELTELGRSTTNVIDELRTHVGGPDFEAGLALAEKLRGEFEGKLSAFRAGWMDCGSIPLPDIERLAVNVDARCREIAGYADEHERREDERREAARALQEKVESSRRHRRVAFALFFLLSTAALILFGSYYYLDEKNASCARAIAQAVDRSDYDGARRLHSSMHTIEWLGIDRDDYLCRGFAERLDLAAKMHEVGRSHAELNSKLEEMRGQLDGVDASPEENGGVCKICDNALAAYRELPSSSVPFCEMVRTDVDMSSMALAVERCDSLLKSSIEAVEKALARRKDQLRKFDFKREMQNAEALLRKVGSEVGGMDLASVTNGNEAFARHVCKLRMLASNDETDVKEVAEFEKGAAAIRDSLKTRQDELRKEMRAGAIAAVQSAMATNSVELAWEKFDSAVDLTSGEVESGELSKLKETLLDFTVKTYEQRLAEVEKTVVKLRADSVISVRLLDAMRTALNCLEDVQNGLRSRIRGGNDAAAHVEARVDAVRTMLPVVVQIDGVSPGDDRPVGVSKSGNSLTIMDGISPETQKQCVYLLIRRDELPSGSSRFVRVADADGNAHHLAIPLSKLVPGISRFDLKGRLINGKDAQK